MRFCSYGFFTYVGSNEPDVPPFDGYRPYGTLVQGNVFDTWHMGKLKQADSTTVTGKSTFRWCQPRMYRSQAVSSRIVDLSRVQGETCPGENVYESPRPAESVLAVR